jgi:competence protein ComEA
MRLAVVLVGALGVVPAAIAAAPQLPDGPGRAEMQKVCGACHEANRAASLRLTEEGWQTVIDGMKARGAKGTDEEFAAVLKYLAANFLGEAAQPLNINKAAAIDLESVAGLTRREAAAVRAWVDKSGPCKKLEDLKQVSGLDYKKIDDRKEFLVCF